MNSDMNDPNQLGSDLPEEPLSSLRDRQVEATRNSILDAFLDLAHEANAVNVSVPAVARKAGVSTRTVYRYFESKDELQNAAAYRISSQALGGGDVAMTTAMTMLDTLKAMWTSFDEQRPALVAEHCTPAGRSIRVTRLDGARDMVVREAPEIDDESRDLIIAVTSSSMFLELVDRMSYPPEVAAAMATRVAHLVIADAEERS